VVIFTTHWLISRLSTSAPQRRKEESKKEKKAATINRLFLILKLGRW